MADEVRISLQDADALRFMLRRAVREERFAPADDLDAAKGILSRLNLSIAAVISDALSDGHESAQPCGCDPGAGWICAAHRQPISAGEPGMSRIADDAERTR